MRIADVLSHHSDGDEVEAGGTGRWSWGLNPPTPGLTISRWLPANLSFKIGRRKKKGRAGHRAAGPPVVAAGSESEARGSPEVAVHSGRKVENFHVSMGMGIGLVFLLAKSAAEVNDKMIQLRAEMESIRKLLKQELQMKDATASSPESIANVLLLPSHCCSNTTTSQTTNCSSIFALQQTKCAVEFDSDSECTVTSENTRRMSFSQMEAEMEVELERLQHNLEVKGSSTIRERIEDDCERYDPSSESFNINSEKQITTTEAEHNQYHGVSAHELERKLHELLETRQQERIAELESALERAEKRLCEKENELELQKGTQWTR